MTTIGSIFPIPAQTFVGIITCVVMISVILLSVTGCIYFERKISAYIQDRIGPNRVGFGFGVPALEKLTHGFGFWGLGQALADGLKFLLKEDYMPRGADRALFTLAPMLAIIPAFIGWAIVPWGGYIDINSPILIGSTEIVAPGRALVGVADINIGFVYLLAVASLGIYGVTLGGWASNNKYSFLGSMRASAGMISYEIPMGASILAVLLVAGSLRPSAIVEGQIASGWYLIAQPFAAVLFFTCILAEANRAPFDNAEAEQELVGGYHTEYSSMRFALFFLAEYAHMITSSSFFVILFLGGYHLPGIRWTSPEVIGIGPAIVKAIIFFAKAMLTVIFMMFVRWTLPRIRYDQVLKLCWQALIPLSITLLVATSIMIFLGLTSTFPMLVMNGVLLAALLIILVVWAPAKFPRFNRRLPLAGSRFSPLPGAEVVTAPTDPTALHDDPFRAAATHS